MAKSSRRTIREVTGEFAKIDSFTKEEAERIVAGMRIRAVAALKVMLLSHAHRGKQTIERFFA
jgi:hypothetical protein